MIKKRRQRKRKSGYKYIRKHLVSCIVIYWEGTQHKGAGPYQNVKDNNFGIERFKKFVRRVFPTARYFNLYDPTRPHGENFLRREYL